MLADVIGAAVAGDFFLDPRIADGVGKLRSVFGIRKSVVITEVDVGLFHALEVGDNFRYRPFTVQAEIGGPNDAKAAAERTSLRQQRETRAAASSPAASRVMRNIGFVMLAVFRGNLAIRQRIGIDLRRMRNFDRAAFSCRNTGPAQIAPDPLSRA